jgi:3-hydroxyacyl-CoA dehydrogenase
MQRMVEKGRLSEEDMVSALQRITPTSELADLAPSDVVIEAVAEDLQVKRELFAELAPALKPDAVLSTTTSSLPIVECAMVTDRPDQVIGLHFFNPAPVMKLVEVVRTVVTEQPVVEDVEALAARLGKVDVTIGDKAGFIAATRLARRTVVTVASERVEFKVPVRAGQLVELVARVASVGRTSITTAVEMYVEDLLSGERRLATSGSFVFVAVDEAGRPTPVAPRG